MESGAAPNPEDEFKSKGARTERVAVETATHLIRGSIALPREGYRARFSDHLNRHDVDYLSLTDAERVPLEGGEPTTYGFLAVARSAVVFGYPLEDENS
ncbi:MAG: hypothetical protein QOI84_917 [Solirubrobacterales bacterium]|jgi:hypothetical protein|nr:hypothetical protein [Solirubrobacterales bacterium]